MIHRLARLLSPVASAVTLVLLDIDVLSAHHTNRHLDWVNWTREFFWNWAEELGR